MKILVLNCGSSSIKYALYNMDDKSVMTSGGAERVGLDGAFVKVKLPNGEKKNCNARHSRTYRGSEVHLHCSPILKSALLKTSMKSTPLAIVWCTEARSSTRAWCLPTRCSRL